MLRGGKVGKCASATALDMDEVRERWLINEDARRKADAEELSH
jgi:hypothetical protein